MIFDTKNLKEIKEFNSKRKGEYSNIGNLLMSVLSIIISIISITISLRSMS